MERRDISHTSPLLNKLSLKGRRSPVLILIAVCAVLVGFGAVRFLSRPVLTVEQPVQAEQSESDTTSKQDEQKGQPQTSRIVVDVDGAVNQPGVFDVEGSDIRVRDAIEAAGGLTGDADTAQINLAATITDGTKIHIPTKGENAATSATAQTTQSDTASPSSGSSASPSAPAASSVSSPSSSGSVNTAVVNINTATAEELETLPGVGASTAQKIVQNRTEQGPFASKEDLMRVSGIGKKKYAKLESRICV